MDYSSYQEFCQKAITSKRSCICDDFGLGALWVDPVEKEVCSKFPILPFQGFPMNGASAQYSRYNPFLGNDCFYDTFESKTELAAILGYAGKFLLEKPALNWFLHDEIYSTIEQPNIVVCDNNIFFRGENGYLNQILQKEVMCENFCITEDGHLTEKLFLYVENIHNLLNKKKLILENELVYCSRQKTFTTHAYDDKNIWLASNQQSWDIGEFITTDILAAAFCIAKL